MNDFYATWSLIRGRFDDTVAGLNHEQLSFRLHEKALTLGETILHVAGVEIWFIAQLKGETLPEHLQKVILAATHGVVNDLPFPFQTAEITPDLVYSILAEARAYAEPSVKEPSDALLSATIKSALGPIIDGRGALARLAYHPGYHQGQAYLILTAPAFPSAK